MRDSRKLRSANLKGSYFFEKSLFDHLNLAKFYDEKFLRTIQSELDIPDFQLPSLRESLAAAEIRYDRAKKRDATPSPEQRRADLEDLLRDVSEFGERNMQLWFDDRKFIERYLSSKASLRDGIANSEPSCPKSEKFPQLAICQTVLEALDAAVRKAIERLPRQAAGRRRIGAIRAWCDELAAFWCYQLGRNLTIDTHKGDALSPAAIFFHRLLTRRAPAELPRLPRALQDLRRKFPAERNHLPGRSISLSD
jgi:hypothetical protein